MPSPHDSFDRDEPRLGFAFAFVCSLLIWGALVLAIVLLA
jgi:hypothetical protein